MKKSTLKQNAEFNGKLLAIRTVMPDYRLSYFLSKELGLTFQKGYFYPFRAEEAKEPAIFYSAEDQENPLRFFLLPNHLKGTTRFLIDRYKQIDFIFVIESNGPEVDASPYLAILKEIANIEAAFEISYELFKPEKFLDLD